MSQNPNLPIAVGIDVGTNAVRCVIGLHEEGAPAPSIIGVGMSPNTGVRKGVVVDMEDTVSAITAAVDEAERIAGVNVESATVGINGSHILAVNSKGIIAVGSANREISLEDLARAEEAATVMQLPPNREIIQTFARNYTIDGQEHVKDPIGMNGMRLEVDACLISGATPFIKNVARTVNQAGVSINHQVAMPLAAATTVASKRHKELGCIVIDIGASTTGIAVFEEGEILDVAILPIGSSHITNDIAIGLRTDIETAEKIKLENININPRAKQSNAGFTVKELNGESMSVLMSDVTPIAQARAEEIFSLIDKELRRIKRDGMLPAGALICGGGANLRGIEEMAKHVLRLPAQVASPEGFSGIIDKIQDPAYAAAIGLMMEDMLSDHPEGSLSSMVEGARHFIETIWHRFTGS